MNSAALPGASRASALARAQPTGVLRLRGFCGTQQPDVLQVPAHEDDDLRQTAISLPNVNVNVNVTVTVTADCRALAADRVETAALEIQPRSASGSGSASAVALRAA